MKEPFLLKDHLFSISKVTLLSTRIKNAYQKFDDARFASNCADQFPNLELKQRVDFMTELLCLLLPQSLERSGEIIVESLPETLDPTKEDGDFGDFIYGPLGGVIATKTTPENLPQALEYLRECTKRFSVEFSLRKLLEKGELREGIIEALGVWVGDQNYHVRRLVSEVTRPNLPWSGKLNLNTTQTLPLLKILVEDKTRYVVRSVCNHLNDLSKIDPTLVILFLREWERFTRKDLREISYIKNHALRTLKKSVSTEALEFLGYKPVSVDAEITLDKKSYIIGESAVAIVKLKGVKEDANVLVDIVCVMPKKNGRVSQKVYSVKQFRLMKNEKIILSKKIALKKATTYVLYPGLYTVILRINGKEVKKAKFDFKA